MKKSLALLLSISTVVCVGGLYAVAAPTTTMPAEAMLPFAEVPAVVQEGFKREGPTATIKLVEREIHKSSVVYEADVIADGCRWEIKLGEDGSLISKELDDEHAVYVAADQLPANVSSTLTKAAGGGTVVLIEQEEEERELTYSAIVVADGTEWEIEIRGNDGQLLKKARADASDDEDGDDKHEDHDGEKAKKSQAKPEKHEKEKKEEHDRD